VPTLDLQLVSLGMRALTLPALAFALAGCLRLPIPADELTVPAWPRTRWPTWQKVPASSAECAPPNSAGTRALLRLNRGSPMGGPAYLIVVYADGTIAYEGVRNVRVKGWATAKISTAAIAHLRRAFDRAGFATFPVREEENPLLSFGVLDCDSAELCWADGGEARSIHFVPCDPRVGALKTLAGEVDRTIPTSTWVRRDWSNREYSDVQVRSGPNQPWRPAEDSDR
jgi:hypothetical protein